MPESGHRREKFFGRPEPGPLLAVRLVASGLIRQSSPGGDSRSCPYLSARTWCVPTFVCEATRLHLPCSRSTPLFAIART
jgi:hypothetical protein